MYGLRIYDEDGAMVLDAADRVPRLVGKIPCRVPANGVGVVIPMPEIVNVNEFAAITANMGIFWVELSPGEMLVTRGTSSPFAATGLVLVFKL